MTVRLLVSLKDRLDTKTAEAFRQVETWAAQGTWVNPTMSSGWSTPILSGNCPVQYMVDPIGWVHFRGSTNYYSGTIGPGLQTVFTIPLSFSPRYSEDFSSPNVQPSVQVDPSGTVSIFLTAATLNPTCNFSGILFTTF